jgi:hypothetical protein
MGIEAIPKNVPEDVEIQLNWSEYFQGQWTTHKASGFGNPITKSYSADEKFEKDRVFIFASLSDDGSLLINLDKPINKVFRVISKNSPPQPIDGAAVLSDPIYSGDQVPSRCINRYLGKGRLNVQYTKRLEIENDTLTAADVPPVDIIQGLDKEANYYLLLPNRLHTVFDELNAIAYRAEYAFGCFSETPSVVDALKKLVNFVESLQIRFFNSSINTQVSITTEWANLRKDLVNQLQNTLGSDACVKCLSESILDPIEAALSGIADKAASDKLVEASKSELKNLVHPFFYMDDHNTFFVEPALTEKTIQEWEDWIISAIPETVTLRPVEIAVLPVQAFVPIPKPPEPESIDPVALFALGTIKDWVTNPATTLIFEKGFIGEEGGLNVDFLSGTGKRSDAGTNIRVNSTSEMLRGTAVSSAHLSATAAGTYQLGVKQLNVVGNAGVTTNMLNVLIEQCGGM